EDIADCSIRDVDRIVLRVPRERDHARALEEAIVHHEQLDVLATRALRRQEDALQLLDLYQKGAGQRLREISDEIIDAEFQNVVPPPVENAPPLAPPEEKSA